MTDQVVIQDTWNDFDDQELIDYLITSPDITHQVQSHNDILANQLPDVLFADTCTVQQLVNYTVPTYPSCFVDLYNRSIITVDSTMLQVETSPYFIKPFTNNKSFDAVVVKDKYDIAYIQENCTNNTTVYRSDYVKFVNEYRMFIEKNSVFAMQESSSYVLDTSTIVSVSPPSEFINKVLSSLKDKYPYIVVDIGMTSDRKWCVVEANPPYALSSYDLDVAKYYEYCKRAWGYISKLSKN